MYIKGYLGPPIATIHITATGTTAGTSVLGMNLYFFAAILSTTSGVNLVTPITG